MKAAVRIIIGLAIVWLIYFAKANVYFRYYPAVMVSVFLAMFATSLFRTPMAEVFARRMGEKLDEKGVAYCRKVTVAWTVFLSLNLGVTVWTVFLSREVWALYNGCISYLLTGVMFLGEFIIRKRVRNG